MATPIWERIAWPDEFLQTMYRDWGVAFSQKDQLDIAIRYYNKSLELKNDDEKSLYSRGKCNLKMAYTEKALADTDTVGALRADNVEVDLLNCRALYELNRLEDAKRTLHDDARKYVGYKTNSLKNFIIVVDENFKDSLGPSFGPFVQKNEKYLQAVLDEYERRAHVETRPLWKILKEGGKCDVQSVIDKEEELLSPREVARRERAFRVFNQIYLNQSWKDVVFLRDMRKNETLLWPPSKVSAPFLKNLVETKYETVKKFEKMLHVRSPLYNETMVKFGSKRVWEKNREKTLNRVQYQTRRNMITILRTIKKLRKSGEVEKLAKYVEQSMGDYVVLKTNRVMPWKFEFMNEVYNTLGLAYADRYLRAPDVPSDVPQENRILFKLRLPTEHKEKPAFVFGDRSTYQEPDAVDHRYVAYKNYLARLEKRIIFAKYPIEKCYLLHEIARAHLKNHHFDECNNAARKSIEEVKNFNNNLWAFLSAMLIVKSTASVYKIERCHDALAEAYDYASFMKSPPLEQFVSNCQEFNNYDIIARLRARSNDPYRKRKSKGSSLSSAVSSSKTSPESTDEEEEEPDEINKY